MPLLAEPANVPIARRKGFSNDLLCDRRERIALLLQLSRQLDQRSNGLGGKMPPARGDDEGS